MSVIQIQIPQKRLALSCTKCGSIADAACDCGSPYIPAKARAAEAVAANPGKSDRAIAADIGVAPNTVRAAREATAQDCAVEGRVGLDGRTYRMPGREPAIADAEGLDTAVQEAVHAVKRTIGGHGYVKVDARGVFITRRDDYREQATLPRSVYGKMLQFDEDKTSVRPFNFTLHFNLTTKIAKYTKEEIEKREERRRELRGQGKIKKYDPAKRYMGIAFSEKRA